MLSADMLRFQSARAIWNSLQELGCLSITFAWRPKPGPNLSVRGTTSSWHWKHLKTALIFEGNKTRETKRSSLIIIDHLSSFAMNFCGLHGLQIPRFLSAKSHKPQWHHTRGHAELQDGGLFRTKVNFTETNPQNQKKRLELFDKFRNFQDMIFRHICG